MAKASYKKESYKGQITNEISGKYAQHLYRMSSAINHKMRQKIISLLRTKDRCTVTEVYIYLRVEQSVASQHLGRLRIADIVNTEREGKFIYYSVNEDILNAYETALAAYSAHLELLNVKV
jgi:DNA-binding transcriptional ArsR family regulator